MNRVSDDDRFHAVFFLGARCQSGVRTTERRDRWHSEAVDGRPKGGRGPQGQPSATHLQRRRRKFGTLTATIETKLTQQGNLAAEVESLKNDVADTQRSLAADRGLAAKLAESCSGQSSEWEERQKSRLGEGAPC